MSSNQDGFFSDKSFTFWSFFLVNVNNKTTFEINVSRKTIESLNVMKKLEKYNIKFEYYLITSPLSDIITIDFNKYLPVAYFSYIIDKAEKNESIITLEIINEEFCFTFSFLK